MPNHRTPRRRKALILAITAILTAATLTATSPATADTNPHLPELPETVSATVQPSPQIDGVAWSTHIRNGIGYVGGKFQTARPFGAAEGQNTSPARNFLAFDLKTGKLLPKFVHNLNGAVQDVMSSPDGKTIYVAGEFTRINDQARYRIAAFDATSGQLTDFKPTVDYHVNSIAVHGDKVFFGGRFSSVNNRSRSNLAAVNSAGQLLRWAPRANHRVQALVVSPNGSRVVAGGHFTELAGRQAQGWGAIRADNGAGLPWSSNQILTNSGRLAAMFDLDSDQDGVYVTGYAFGTHNFEGIAAATWDGRLRWIKACKGDTYGVAVMDKVSYGVHHTHDCDPMGGIPQRQPWIYQRADATTTTKSPFGRVNHGGSHNGHIAPELLHWYPDFPAGTFTGIKQGPWAVDAAEGWVLTGGEFPSVNGIKQYGIALFAKKAVAPAKEGAAKPHELNARLRQGDGNRITVDFRGLYDRDSHHVTYELLRGDTKVASTTISGNVWWKRQNGSLTDPAPVDGEHSYRVRVVDALGNEFLSPPMKATVTGAPKPSKYATMIRSHGAKHHWRLGENDGTTAHDDASSNHIQLSDQARRGVPGAIKDDENTATEFNDNSLVPGAASVAARSPQKFAIETWFKTTSNQGGALVNYSSSRTGASWYRDRFVYMNNEGNLLFGVYDAERVHTVKSKKTYNDGQWHHAVANFGPTGLQLYVDGQKVAELGRRINVENYDGYWRIGGENLRGWPEIPRSANFKGSLDEVAIYPNPLTPEIIQEHFGSTPPPVDGNKPPEAAFTTVVKLLDVNVDAVSSSDPDGTIKKYSWDFGDGNKGDGAALKHSYEAAGTYTVRLTVTDDKGATDSTEKKVSVSPDGKVPGGGDGDGGNVGDGSKVVEDFNRQARFSWGNPTLGGSWSLKGNPASFSVTDGHGVINMHRRGIQRSAWLQKVAAQTTKVRTKFNVTEPITGGGVYLGITGRAVGTDQYKTRAKLLSDGTVQLALRRAQGASETTLAAKVPLSGIAQGTTLHLKTETIGANPTTVAAKIWADGTPEPADWQIRAEDSTPSLQKPGYVGLVVYLSSSAETGVKVRFDEFMVN